MSPLIQTYEVETVRGRAGEKEKSDTLKHGNSHKKELTNNNNFTMSILFKAEKSATEAVSIDYDPLPPKRIGGYMCAATNF